MRVQLHLATLEDKETMESAVIECDDSLNSLLKDYEALIKNVQHRNNSLTKEIGILRKP